LAGVEEPEIQEAQALGRHFLRALIWAMYAIQRERMTTDRKSNRGPVAATMRHSSDDAAYNPSSSFEIWEE